MKHSLAVRFLVMLLTAICLVAALAGIMSIVSLEGAGLYINSLDELQDHEYESIARNIANDYAVLYAMDNLGNINYWLRKDLCSDPVDRSDYSYWYATLSEKDTVIATLGPAHIPEVSAAVYTFTVVPLYAAITPEKTEDATQPDDPSAQPPKEEPLPDNYLYSTQKTLWINTGLVTYPLDYYQAPEYTVTVYLHEEVLDSSALHILTSLYPMRYSAIAVLIIGLILFAAGLVFLLWSAGVTADGTVRPGGLNRIPLDIYFLLVVIGEYLLALLFSRLISWTQYEGPHWGNLSLLTVNLSAIILLALGFLCAIAAQLKVKAGYWWRHSGIYRLAKRIGQFLRFGWRCLSALAKMLPLMWQWILVATILLVITCVTGYFTRYSVLANWLFLLSLLSCIATVVYGGYAFGALISGAKRMRDGDLSHKIPTEYLLGSFRDFALELNTLLDTAKQAAENEMRAERMRSELITNVSHDIKTPLTSIINFVDLLQKPHTDKQEQEYLEVLSRQSGRMKKLIEDLIELSKATTGNITVNITTLDAAETVHQALGEFSDKLEAAGIVSVFRQPETPILIQADGRLMWRVLSNLLSNAQKYALSGTRLYVELEEQEDQVLLSLKNVSKEPLTIHASELMERFVRGDTSRGSEGSGLGLNIAKSLMEVQNGQMHLSLDGDLFKVTLYFPADR